MDFLLPELGEGVYEAEMQRWLVQVGEAIKPGQGLLEVLTDKATMEVPAPFAGTISALHVQAGDKIKIGQPILAYGGTEKAAPTPVAAGAQRVPAPTNATPARNGPVTAVGALAGTAVKAAPSVRQLAHKLGLDLAKVKGTGPHGRILVEDLKPLLTTAVAEPKASKPEMPAIDYGKPGTRIKLHGVRRRIAERMVFATHTIPHYTYVDECDLTDLVKLREGLKEACAKKGVRLTYLAFFVKAVVAALKEMPIVNASLDETAGEIVLHDRYNIGIATAAPTGLIVPVVKDADLKSVFDIAKEIERLTTDVRNNKSTVDDLRGGTFTLTSIGSIGGLFATPIINHPEVGILGIGKITKRPVFDEHDQIRAADMIYLSLAFDHRVLDGAIAVAFGNALIRRLQNPATLFVED